MAKAVQTDEGTDKTCIVCRKPKSEFNLEHVIPAAIGGAFIIDMVCTDCNEWLGKEIDRPFLNHRMVLLERQERHLSRRGRDIRNPFLGIEATDKNGNTVYISANDGKFEAQRKPKFEYFESEQGKIGRLSIAKKDMNDKALERYRKKYEEETGNTIGRMETVIVEEVMPVSVTISDENNKIIMECLKIGYESAIACLPEYFCDPLAIAYSDMLLSGKPERSLQAFVNPNDLPDFIDKAIDCYPFLHAQDCFTILMNVPERGLICMIKIFSIYYAFILSERTDYFDDRLLVLLNNSHEEQFGCSVLKTAASFTFGLTEEIQHDANATSNPFQNSLGLIPLYNEKGEKLLDHIEQLTILGFANKKPESLATLATLKYSLNDGHYLRSTLSNQQHKVIEITLNY